jgi:hypothetical protein
MRSAAFLAALGLALGLPPTAVLAQATMPGHAPRQPEVQVKLPARGSFFGPVSGLGEGRFSNGDRYEGELKNGKPDGVGKMDYMLGGSYEGEWKNGRRDGKGVMSFAGSGRRADVRFVDDRRVDVAMELPSEATVSAEFSLLSDDEAVGSHIRNKVVYGPLPLDQGFDELTPEQQRFVRSYYPALDAGDDPPYPLRGGKELYKLLVSMIRHIGVKDEILVYVAVDADGNVSSVTTISTLDAKQKDLIATAAGLLKYKPAQCSGLPCAGVVPFNLGMRPVI